MKNNHLKKLNTLLMLKLKNIFLNPRLLLYVLMPIGMVVLMKFLYGNINHGELPPKMQSMVLNFGLIFNISMSGILLPSMMIAEEKENHTLRTLITSSVTAMEYFLANLLPTLFVLMLVNFACVPLSGFNFQQIPLGNFTFVTFIASLTSCLLGIMFGMAAKNQMNASMISMPFTMILMMLPLFKMFNKTLEKISDFFYSGVVTHLTDSFTTGKSMSLSITNWAVLLGEVIMITILCIYFYKQNGFEKD